MSPIWPRSAAAAAWSYATWTNGNGTAGFVPGIYEVRWFAWKTDRRLILEVYAQSHPFGSEPGAESHLIALDIDGSHQRNLVQARPERAADWGQDQVIDLLPDDPDHVLIAVDSGAGDSSEIVKVNVNTGSGRTIVDGQNGITNWKTDPAGQVRLGTAVRDRIVRTYYRDDADSNFRLIHEADASQTLAFSVLAISDVPGVLYVAATGETGRRSIYSYDVRQGKFLNLYAGRPDVDIDSLLIDHGRALGYGYTIDEPELVYTDAGLRIDADRVAKALPQFHTTIVDGTADGHRLLILANGGNRPGSYYLLTRTREKATLSPLGDIRPDIPDDTLALVKPKITYRAADGLDIHGYVTLPKGVPNGPIPFVVMPHGGPSARDVLGFDYIAQMIASRGYGVFQPNFRGSKGYGAAFERAGFQEWGLAMQDDVTAGTRWLIDQKLADPNRICIVGWSYGGYSALIAAVKTPDLFRCAASMAGVSDLRRRLDRASHSRFADLNVPRMDSDPAMIAANSPVLHADRIKIPILLAHGRRDFTVPVEDSLAMEAALKQAGKPVETIYFGDDDHYLFREEDRIAFLESLSRFLRDNLGPGVTTAATN